MKVGWARGGMSLVLCCTLILAGCSTNWINEAEQIVTALIPAAANIVALVAAVQGKGVSASDMQLIQNAAAQAGADLQLIQSLIAAYEKADDAAKPGILNQVESAIAAVQENLQGLVNGLHIQDAATQAKVTAVIGILLSEVKSLAGILPVVKQGSGAGGQGTVTARMSAVIGHGSAPLPASDFVASYNATLTARTGNAELDRVTAGLKIHEHGAVARVVSGGMLK
jgi:hypothetical protein